MQDPKKILHRMKINDMIFKYKNVLHEDNIEYLLEKTKNGVVFRLIESMDEHFKNHHFRGDSSQNQF